MDERELLGQIFSGVLALFGILIAVVGILLGLYVNTKAVDSPLVSLLWWLIIGIAVATALSGLTAGLALRRLDGANWPMSLIRGLVYGLLFSVSACVLVVAIVGLRYF